MPKPPQEYENLKLDIPNLFFTTLS